MPILSQMYEQRNIYKKKKIMLVFDFAAQCSYAEER